MAAIRSHDGILAFTSGNSIAVTNIRNPETFHVISLPPGTEVKSAKTEEEEDGAGGGGGSGGGGVNNNNNRALASGFSGHGRYFALCDDLKRLHVFSTGTLPWTLLSSRPLARRATSLTFTLDEGTVLVSDKSGDVYSFPTLLQQGQDGNEEAQVKGEDKVKDGDKVKEEEVKDGNEGKTDGQLVLGHLSMVLDLCLTGGDRYVATCDRDEKIRVSHFPNGYNIHAFCLGHTQFVSCLLYVEEFRVLISGSGDGTLAVWDMEGKQLCRACLPATTSGPVRTAQAPPPPPDHPTPCALPAGGREEEGEGVGRMEGEKEEEEEGRRAVRRIVYCKENRLLFVTSYRGAEVLVFQLKTRGRAGGGGGSSPSPSLTLTHLHTLPLPSAPWDLAWADRSATLWVLCPEEGATLSAFRLRKGGEEGADETIKLCKVTDTDSGRLTDDTQGATARDTDRVLTDTARTVNDHWSFFTESLCVASELPGLWKTSRQDNVLQYQQRKQQRLQAQQPQPPPPQQQQPTTAARQPPKAVAARTEESQRRGEGQVQHHGH
ncbi:uncharacterized protein LOC143286511 [Babylonia areolata]|uniref:uncharacterized protein LOC143286511 n=1 Tax=Babylonia areolata TaxID=304850 RepID=UPI003FD4D9FC